MFLKILTVAGLATFEIYAAIPAGFAFGLSPWIIFFASLAGGLAGAIVAAVASGVCNTCNPNCPYRDIDASPPPINGSPCEV